MDDDDLRRGRPTCHKAFDEATAILVGDALQPLAFQLLARDASLPSAPAVRLRLIDLLAEASGTFGMAGGQAIDLAVSGRMLDISQVEDMHARKTGAIIRASVLMAAECAPDLERALYAGLDHYACAIGLAFQIQDDLLDITSDVATMGKPVRADSQRAQPTHPAIIGIAASQERMHRLHKQALDALSPFGDRAEPLRLLAQWLLSRRH
jgi:farnesyl diphosphate synthase